MDPIDIIAAIADLNSKRQNQFFATLRGKGFTAEDIASLQKQIFYYKLFTDQAFYKSVESAIGHQLYAGVSPNRK